MAVFWTHWVKGVLEAIGGVSLQLGSTLRYILKGRIQWSAVFQQAATIGFDSVPMAILISSIAGSVLALQTALRFAQTGADSYVGGLVSLAIVREIAPIFTALAVTARSGTGLASEIANMSITEQIDALKIMRMDPIRYLFVPRLIASVIVLPMLTILSALVAIGGGMIVAHQVSRLHTSKFLDSVWTIVTVHDVTASLVKALVFGLLIAIIACSIGLNTRGGAGEVGQATTKTAVWTSITIIIFDFILTWSLFGTQFSE